MIGRSCLIAPTLLLAGCLAGDSSGSEPDRRWIQGTWKVRSAESADGVIPAQQLGEVRWIITDDQLRVQAGNDDPMTLRYTLDPSKTPKHIDTTHEIDSNEPMNQLGIYEIEGDELRLCIASADLPRPSAFGDPAAMRIVLERVESKAKQGPAQE